MERKRKVLDLCFIECKKMMDIKNIRLFMDLILKCSDRQKSLILDLVRRSTNSNYSHIEFSEELNQKYNDSDFRYLIKENFIWEMPSSGKHDTLSKGETIYLINPSIVRFKGMPNWRAQDKCHIYGRSKAKMKRYFPEQFKKLMS